ncbi:3-hydroxyacyl-CoA dehydrogenase/enoyl-CoA hydratase family protein [Acidianus sp. HS-5]|uniref:3-hydroxyacyl-CoA dehydrogenase/enoyl-CoA hydratase family protein n=1 Tax=Acidianus sp. HS-5 TaxID=2886040 RepID=UPI001F33C828|nr:3-hydroxyacyl-CoA dehydrogenase/enoyl-CoA hydratase family protein [Acidianus sp. HS-5]BDC18812.1 3-hydroxyacyl-CoA dehydrogenase [Acidianus sp. HS-5]
MIRKFTVVGAGTMGHGIAEVAAISGLEVWLNDVAEEILKNAIEKISWSLSKLEEKGQIKSKDEVLSRIHVTTNQEEALKDTDFMIEAVIEDINIKSKVFSKADALSSDNAILASNTSSIPISEIAKYVKNQERVVGMHFFNPPVLMPLVEIVKGENTSEGTVKEAYNLVKNLGKDPVIVNKDIPGFLVNRILFRVIEVACWLVESGKASIEDVDYTAITDLGFPMGIFLLQDYTGLDVGYMVAKAMKERGVKMYECKMFEEKFKSKEFGVKSGKGFYTYPGKFVRPEFKGAKKVNTVLLLSSAINEASYLLREGISSKEDIEKGCKLGLGWPKGIFEYADSFGIDEVINALEELKKETKLENFTPDPLLISMKNEGRLGKKAGKGFYEYGKRNFNTIKYDIDGQIGIITLNRPEKLNVINEEMIKELNQILDEIEEDDRIRVIIIQGSGRAFCAGADISEFTRMTPIKAMIASRKLQELYNKIQFLTKPVISLINGYAIGGGLELVMSTDIRIASSNAQFGQPEINLGIIPGGGGTQRLPKLSRRKALQLILTGENISAKEAEELGIVDEVVDPSELENEGKKIASKISEKSPLALALAKYAVNLGNQTNIWTGEALESSFFGILFSTKDFEEGVKAFMERRRPQFKGE